MDIWIELKRRRTALQRQLALDEGLHGTVEPLSDLADQASFEYEQELTTLGKTRIREQLREVERAIACMEQNTYGSCIRCQKDIPIARLRVQPEALLCVPCQTFDEKRVPVAGGPAPHGRPSGHEHDEKEH